MNLDDIKSYLSIKKSEFDINVLEELKQLKKKAVSESNEALANKIWCYEQIYKIQKMYVDVFEKLKNNQFFDAWRELERIDIELSFLRDNYDYSNDRFHLEFIERIVREYQKLFPYQFFMSRESIVKKEKCSICGKINTIRNRCDHKVGKLYMGEMCSRIVEEFEFLGMSIVQNPFDKYTVLFPKDMEYNYFMLESLIPSLDTPYDRWYVDVLREKNPIYKDIGRNDKCPCGSGKKYKKCCLDTEQEYTNHHRVTLLDKPNVKPIPFTLGSTWKE